jgi:hypothetical protein
VPVGRSRTAVVIRPVRITFRRMLELVVRLALAAGVWVVYDDEPAGDPTLIEVACIGFGAYQVWSVLQILTFGRNGSTQLEFDHDGFTLQETWRRSFVAWETVTGIDIRRAWLLTGRSPGLLIHRADGTGALPPLRVPNVFAMTPEQLSDKIQQLHGIAVRRPGQVQPHRWTASG